MAAEAWGIPPWQVEEQASPEWLGRFTALRGAITDAQERSHKQAARGQRVI